jgi:hypothetical protein
VLTAAGALLTTTGHPGYVLRHASTLQTAIWYLGNNIFIYEGVGFRHGLPSQVFRQEIAIPPIRSGAGLTDEACLEKV